MNIKEFADLGQWAEEQWGGAELGDARRPPRAVKLGASLAGNPEGSLPKQLESWGALKAAYRLLSEADVTHRKLSEPHWRNTKEQVKQSKAGVVLFVQDTSELDYSHLKQTQNLGQIGDGKGRGLMVHSCLAVLPTPGNAEVLGLAGQQVWRRSEAKPKGETRTERAARSRESEVWADMIETIGQAPESEQQWVSVADRGSDVFSYLRRARDQRWHCLFRACQDRAITKPDGTRGRLMQTARVSASMAQTTLTLRGRNGEPKQTIELQVAWSAVEIIPPKQGAERHEAPQSGWWIRVWQDTEAKTSLEWVLFTTMAVNDATDALMQVDWYATRWTIEDYHKCLKTGCGVECRQLTTAEGLERLLGFLAIVAVRLLQLRTLARMNPDSPVQDAVSETMVRVLTTRLKLPHPPTTLGEFWRALARLGGFIGRKGDGNPGWQTLWGGWARLQDLCWGSSFTSNLQ
jgi:hypothetical protein